MCSPSRLLSSNCVSVGDPNFMVSMERKCDTMIFLSFLSENVIKFRDILSESRCFRGWKTFILASLKTFSKGQGIKMELIHSRYLVDAQQYYQKIQVMDKKLEHTWYKLTQASSLLNTFGELSYLLSLSCLVSKRLFHDTWEGQKSFSLVRFFLPLSPLSSSTPH